MPLVNPAACAIFRLDEQRAMPPGDPFTTLPDAIDRVKAKATMPIRFSLVKASGNARSTLIKYGAWNSRLGMAPA